MRFSWNGEQVLLSVKDCDKQIEIILASFNDTRYWVCWRLKGKSALMVLDTLIESGADYKIFLMLNPAGFLLP